MRPFLFLGVRLTMRNFAGALLPYMFPTRSFVIIGGAIMNVTPVSANASVVFESKNCTRTFISSCYEIVTVEDLNEHVDDDDERYFWLEVRTRQSKRRN